MIRTVSTLMVLTALAGPAAAQEVSVSLAGKDARSIDIDIERAAWTVCTEAYLRSSIERADQADCARSVAADAMDRAAGRTPLLAQDKAMGVLASNDSRVSLRQ